MSSQVSSGTSFEPINDPDSLTGSETALVTRKSQQRSSPLTFSFPSEILSLIFECSHQDAFQSQAAPLDAFRSLQHVLNLTHVCSRWRDIALADPLLWSTIVLTWPDEVVDVFVKRCNATGLRLFLNMFDGDKNFFYADAMLPAGKLKSIGNRITENVRSIVTLDLALSVYELDSSLGSEDEDDTEFSLGQMCSPFLNAKAPSLRNFFLSMEGEPEDSHFFVDELFLHHAPNLKTLQLYGTDIRLSRASFPDLTSLSLGISGPHGLLYPLQDIPSVLSQFPRLETLVLEHHSEYLSPAETEALCDYSISSSHTVLQHMGSLTFEGLRGDQIIYILEHLECPSLQTFCTSLSFDQAAETPFPRFPAWMHKIFKDVRRLDLYLVNQGFDIEFANGTPAKSFSWEILYTGMPHSAPDTCLELCLDIFPLLNPEILRFRGAFDLLTLNEPSMHIWRSILSCFSRLNTIIADHRTRIENLIEVLAEIELVCPTLQELDIRGARFIGKRLHRMLVQRRACGGGIRRLNIDMKDCEIYDAERSEPTLQAVNAGAITFDPAYGPKDLVEVFSGDVRFLQHDSIPPVPKFPAPGPSFFSDSSFSGLLGSLDDFPEDFNSFDDINFDRDFDAWLNREP
ncbi:hypothetical protein SISNIDRAFT_551467 [Sistotremastrum niveocremeum HHB9708]|uniref:F-box domain-containing protein n=1 Tax=Sistotremastrum niveocremeum HHB9708 TaxID=1314777 RepID=A0A164RCR2_9AGAM|nr:hypothetical protein SISNIDRAFT_551467 [Sistotremastrum niveocremeum HHB9708]